MAEAPRGDIGMRFELSEEAQAARALARSFADRELRPRVQQYRREDAYPHEVVAKMAELGMLGGTIPERWGGSGMSHEALVAMVEELSTVDHVMAGQASQASALLGTGILRYGSDEQRERFLRPLCAGTLHGAVAMTEPQGGSDVATMTTRVRRAGGDFVLDGQKLFVSHVGEAGFFVTFAQTDPDLGRKGICAFLVEADSPGLTVLPIEGVGVLLPHSWGQVFFDAVRVPASAQLGSVGDGLRVAMAALEVGRVSIAARACGAARECLAAATDYARHRTVGGSLIGRHQHVQRRLADMLISIDAARLLVYQAAAQKDAGVEQARVDAGIAKLFACQMLERVASDTIDIFGGYGLTADQPWVQYLKDAKAMQVAEGTTEVQYGLIAETMLGFRPAGRDAALELLRTENVTTIARGGGSRVP